MKLIGFILIINLVQVICADALIDPKLQNLAAQSPEKIVKVILVLSELPYLAPDLSPSAKIKKLMEISRSEQLPIIEMLTGMRAKSPQSLWIANSIAVEVQAGQIALIASMDGVQKIEENTEIFQEIGRAHV